MLLLGPQFFQGNFHITGHAMVENRRCTQTRCAKETDRPMFLKTPLPCVKEFVDELSTALETDQPGRGLSRLQRLWLAFCLTGIVVTNTVCWARFERASLGTYALAA